MIRGRRGAVNFFGRSSDPTPAQVVDNRIQIDGINVHYRTAGEGPNLILLHGGILDAATLSFNKILNPLAKSHRVIAPDLPGYGESDRPRIRYTLSFYQRFLHRFIDDLQIKDASVAAISMGGAIALGYLLQHPRAFRRLVLMSTYGIGTTIPWRAWQYLAAGVLPFQDAVNWSLSKSPRFIDYVLKDVVFDRSLVDSETSDELARLLRRPKSGRAFRSFLRSEINPYGFKTDYSARLPKLETPTLIIHGGHDQLIPVAYARRAYERLPNATLKIYRDCGHWPPQENPAKVLRDIQTFLAEGYGTANLAS